MEPAYILVPIVGYLIFKIIIHFYRLILFAIIIGLTYNLIVNFFKESEFFSKMNNILDTSIMKSSQPMIQKQATQLEELCGSDCDTECELIQELKHVEEIHIQNYARLIRLLRYANKHGNRTLIQNISGPSNNNNVNLGLEVNLFPISL